MREPQPKPIKNLVRHPAHNVWWLGSQLRPISDYVVTWPIVWHVVSLWRALRFLCQTRRALQMVPIYLSLHLFAETLFILKTLLLSSLIETLVANLPCPTHIECGFQSSLSFPAHIWPACWISVLPHQVWNGFWNAQLPLLIHAYTGCYVAQVHSFTHTFVALWGL